MNKGTLSAASPRNKTGSLLARLSFAIDNPNGFKESKYYHIPNLAINRWAYTRVSVRPKIAPLHGQLGVRLRESCRSSPLNLRQYPTQWRCWLVTINPC